MLKKRYVNPTFEKLRKIRKGHLMLHRVHLIHHSQWSSSGKKMTFRRVEVVQWLETNL